LSTTPNSKSSHQNINRPANEGFLVLDYGSQYTLLIARRLRELGLYAEVIDGMATEAPDGFKFYGIILSGGPDTVTEVGSRRLPSWVMASGKPILGVCYGMQLLVEHFGGELRSGKGREYGHAEVNFTADMATPAAKVFYATPTRQAVWMSHGDDIAKMPACLLTVGTSTDGVVAAVVHRELPIVGLQYHPEVRHTTFGRELLQKFARDLCRADVNWDGGSMLQATLEYSRLAVGKGHALVACSGGVDSTVAAALLAKSLGPENVTAVFCDHGLMRKGEVKWVSEQLKKLGLKHVETLNSQKIFLDALQGVTDPEAKRKIIGRLFIEEFERYAKGHKDEFTHLGQGTLYPDVIESAGHGAGAKVIKSHHNVGGLPEKLALKLVEPLRFLFKDEVRDLGEQLGLPRDMVHRHPFPGPGLAVRILGEITEERLKILREADAVFIQALRDHNYYESIWQAFAVLLPVKSVGVMGDNRTYQMTIALRAVTSSDAMTAGVGDLPMSFLTKVAADIVKKVDGVNRVVYDITTKPPATIEWE
jgi:GMP synthase (glutamine-hydrolysing)